MEYFYKNERKKYLLEYNYNDNLNINKERINKLINDINNMYNYIKDIKIEINNNLIIKGKKNDNDEIKNDYIIYENDIKDLLFENVFKNLNKLIFSLENKIFEYELDKKTTIIFSTYDFNLNKEFIDKILYIMNEALLINNISVKFNECLNKLNDINLIINDESKSKEKEKKEEKYKEIIYDLIKELEYYIKYHIIIKNLKYKNNINDIYNKDFKKYYGICINLILEKINNNYDETIINILINDIYNIFTFKVNV